MANLWQISLAKLVSDPDAIMVNFISSLDLKISYAPNDDLFSETPHGFACLIITVPELFFNEFNIYNDENISL